MLKYFHFLHWVINNQKRAEQDAEFGRHLISEVFETVEKLDKQINNFKKSISNNDEDVKYRKMMLEDTQARFKPTTNRWRPIKGCRMSIYSIIYGLESKSTAGTFVLPGPVVAHLLWKVKLSRYNKWQKPLKVIFTWADIIFSQPNSYKWKLFLPW